MTDALLQLLETKGISDVDFNLLKSTDILHVAETLLKQSELSLKGIQSAQANPQNHRAIFENTFSALDTCTESLERLITWVGHLESVATAPDLRDAYNAIQGPIASFFSGIPLRTELYNSLKSAFAATDKSLLTKEELRFAEKTLRDFEKNGAALPAEQKKRLTEIDTRLAEITNRFSQNVVDATAAFGLHVPSIESLKGLPQHAISMFESAAKQKQQSGYLITLSGPSVQAVMTFADDRNLRKSIWEASSQKASGLPYENEKIITETLALRREKAQLLGFKNFADFVLQNRMAKTGERALAFANDLREKTEAAFSNENKALQDFATQQGFKETLEPWDLAYLSEKMRQATYDFDEELLRPYFVASRVLQACFDVATKLYGITIEERTFSTWHPDVRTFDLCDQHKRLLGSFYVDLYSRSTKRGGAWMNALVTGNSKKNVPHIGLFAMDGTPPSETKPSLMNFREVQTVFHEFGHLLHHMLTEVQVRSLAGTNVAWDFVELPSQIMENWAWEDSVLEGLGKHVDTQESIPKEYITKLKRARNFRSANAMMRQLSFAITDLKLHTVYDPDQEGDVMAYCKKELQAFYPVALPDTFKMFASFGHLFGDAVGYAAGYYSYKWAEMLDADAFSLFKKSSVFDSTLANKFRSEILAKGDSDEPENLYLQFAGRSPDPNALLERSGLLTASS